MGGWMTYQRMRARNGLMFRKPDDDPDPYWREYVGPEGPSRRTLDERSILLGDMNRMERDYLNPRYPEPPWAGREPGSDPLSQVVAATGVDVESVKRVLRYVFMEQL
jgi:hypothetical protein